MPVNSFEDYSMSWRPKIDSSELPLYSAIAQTLERDIEHGTLKPNDKLPPQRELADFLDVNLSTITRAFKLCEAKGLIKGSVGKGTFISSDVKANKPMLSEYRKSGIINLGPSHPLYNENKYITKLLRKMTSKINIENLLQYHDLTGTQIQKENAREWLEQQGITTSTDNILIASGLQNSLAIILSSCFNYGDKILTNSVVYPGLKNIAAMLGIRLIPIPYKNRQLDINYLIQVCKHEKIKGIYLMPDHQNPTALTMSEQERLEVSDVIQRFSLLAIEDGTYTFLSSNQHKPLYHYVPDQVIHICTLSNSLSAGLRISFMVAPLNYREKLLSGIRNINVMSSPLDSELVSQLIQTRLANKIIKEKIQEIEERNTVTEEVLGDFELLGTHRSQFRWLVLPDEEKSHALEAELSQKGVDVFCSDRFLVGNAKNEQALRLAICSPQSLEELREGLTIIKKEIQ